jgi:hypothetical protein
MYIFYTTYLSPFNNLFTNAPDTPSSAAIYADLISGRLNGRLCGAVVAARASGFA